MSTQGIALIAIDVKFCRRASRFFVASYIRMAFAALNGPLRKNVAYRSRGWESAVPQACHTARLRASLWPFVSIPKWSMMFYLTGHTIRYRTISSPTIYVSFCASYKKQKATRYALASCCLLSSGNGYSSSSLVIVLHISLILFRKGGHDYTIGFLHRLLDVFRTV